MKAFHKQLMRLDDRVATSPPSTWWEEYYSLVTPHRVCHMLPLRCNSKLQLEWMYIWIIQYYGMTSQDNTLGIQSRKTQRKIPEN